MRLKAKEKGHLKADEIHQAEQILFPFYQTENFPNVSNSKRSSKEISKTLNIAKKSYFIEEDRTIRVKGRLKRSNPDYNAKHPILLKEKHRLVQLLLGKAHRDNLHEGTEYVRNIPQQEFWIVGLRNALRKKKSRFFKCLHRNANPIHTPMADLPRERLDENVFPFTRTGVDALKCSTWLYIKGMVLHRHSSNNERSANGSHTVIGHQVISSTSYKFYYKTSLHKYHQRRQRHLFHWRSQGTESFQKVTRN